ncbi:hypothetical protein [Rhodosalinus sediminis]|jgi:predicted small lipoprotein YifL|nr:hypothetical protein [Rhodosalinus sediminis]
MRLGLALAALAALAACGADGAPERPGAETRSGVTLSGEARFGLTGAW